MIRLATHPLATSTAQGSVTLPRERFPSPVPSRDVYFSSQSPNKKNPRALIFAVIMATAGLILDPFGWYGTTVKSHGVDVPKEMLPAWEKLNEHSSKNSPILNNAQRWMPVIASKPFQKAFKSILENEGGYYSGDPSYMGVIIGNGTVGKIDTHQEFLKILKRTGAFTNDSTHQKPNQLALLDRQALELAVALIFAKDYWKTDVDGDQKNDPEEVQQVFGELAYNGGSKRARAVVKAAIKNLAAYKEGDFLTAMACEYIKMAYSMADSCNYDDIHHWARLTRYGDLLAAHGRRVTYTEGKDTRSDTLTVDGATYTFQKPVKPVKKTTTAKPIVKKPAAAKGKLKVKAKTNQTKANSKVKGNSKPKQPAKKPPARKH